MAEKNILQATIPYTAAVLSLLHFGKKKNIKKKKKKNKPNNKNSRLISDLSRSDALKLESFFSYLS